MRLNIFFILLLYSLPAPLLAARLELRQAGTDATDITVLVGEEIEVELWVDSESQPLSGTAVFLSFDETAFELVDRSRVTATSGFQPFTPGGFLGNGEIFRNDLLPPDDPAATAPGTQLDYSVVRASDQGAGAVASFRLRARAPSRASTVRIDESGIRETRIFLPDGNQRAFRFITPLRITVQGISITGLPEQLILPRGAIDDATFRLDDLVFDPIYDPADITWEISPTSFLSVVRDPTTNVLQVAAPADDSPWERLILTAANPDGQTATDTVDIFVAAPPSLPASLTPIAFAEDGHFELLLDTLVDDPDTPLDQLQWSGSGSEALAVSIEGPPYLARIAAPPDWHGEAWANFVVVDDFGFADSTRVAVTVEPINDPPQLRISPNVRLINGRQDSSLILANLISDREDETLTLSWNGARQVAIQQRNGRLILGNQDGWIGSEEIVLQVEDSGGLMATTLLTVTVVPSLPPTLLDAPQRRGLAAGDHFVLSLDDLVTDPDDRDQDLLWQISGQQQLRVQLSSDRAARVEAPSAFTGIETLTFTVFDPTDESASFDLVVFSAPLSGEPLLAPLPEIDLPVDGVDTSLDLDDYVFDLDHGPELIEFFLPERDDLQLRVDPITHVLTIAPTEAARPGTLDLELRILDPDGHQAVQSLRVHLSGDPVELPFTFAPIDDVGFVQTETYALDLDDFISGNLDPSQIDWQVEGQEQISVIIDPATHLASLEATDGWSGSEQLTFAATSGNLPIQRRTVTVTVLPSSKEPAGIPELAPLPPLSLTAGDLHQSLDLDDFVSNGDPAAIEWEVKGQQNVHVLIDAETHQLLVITDAEWSGVEILTLSGRDGSGNIVEGALRIEVSSPLPTLALREATEIPLFAGENKIRLDLAELLTGSADPDQLIWEAEGTQPISVIYDPEAEQLILKSETSWRSSVIITLRARDPQGNEATGHLLAQVIPADGSVGLTSPDFEVTVLPNVLQPDYVNIFVVSNLASARPPLLRLDDDIWRDLPIVEHAPGIWQGSHILRPDRQGSIEFMALTIASDRQVFRSSFTMSIDAPSPRAKPLTTDDIVDAAELPLQASDDDPAPVETGPSETKTGKRTRIRR